MKPLTLLGRGILVIALVLPSLAFNSAGYLNGSQPLVPHVSSAANSFSAFPDVDAVMRDGDVIAGTVIFNSLRIPQDATVTVEVNTRIVARTVQIEGRLVVAGTEVGMDAAPRIDIVAADWIRVEAAGSIQGAQGAAAELNGEVAQAGTDIQLTAPFLMLNGPVRAGQGGLGSRTALGGRGGDVLVLGSALTEPKHALAGGIFGGPGGFPGGSGGNALHRSGMQPGSELELIWDERFVAPQAQWLEQLLPGQANTQRKTPGNTDELGFFPQTDDAACPSGANGATGADGVGGNGAEGLPGDDAPWLSGESGTQGHPGGSGGGGVGAAGGSGGGGSSCCPNAGGAGGDGGKGGNGKGGQGGKGGKGGDGSGFGTGGQGGTGGNGGSGTGGTGGTGGNGGADKGAGGGGGGAGTGIAGLAGSGGAGGANGIAGYGAVGSPGSAGAAIPGTPGTKGNQGPACSKDGDDEDKDEAGGK